MSAVVAPVSADANAAQEFHCGPARVRTSVTDRRLLDKVVDALSLYNVLWDPCRYDVQIEVRRTQFKSAGAGGSFLTCARMNVDARDDGFFARTASGATAFGRDSGAGAQWTIDVPSDDLTPLGLIDVEDLLGLALTTAWRRCGWVPIHAGAVMRKRSCVLLCATTGGGKSTLTAALVRRGWQTLGDDKILLRSDAPFPRVAALVHVFNLHPKTRSWFLELPNLELLPKYSAWSEKRRVNVADVWSSGVAAAGRPTHVVQLERRDSYVGIRVNELAQSEILPALLRQTVIPNDRAVARSILTTVAAAARGLRGIRVEIGRDAYRDPACLDVFEDALR